MIRCNLLPRHYNRSATLRLAASNRHHVALRSGSLSNLTRRGASLIVRSVNLGLLSLVLVFLVGTTSAFSKEVTDPGTTVLRDNWFIQPSADVHAGGEAISSVGFSTRDWYPATLPSTVMSALVEDKVYPDPVHGPEPALNPRHDLPDLRGFLQCPHAACQSVPTVVVVSHRVQTPARIQRKNGMAWFRRYQLPGERLDERRADRLIRKCGWHFALLNLNVTSSVKPGQANSPFRCRNISTSAARLGHHIG